MHSYVIFVHMYMRYIKRLLKTQRSCSSIGMISIKCIKKV